ncbi:OmpP1/FadL family transporter [Beijerinckia indica]|uniref:Membrane protein involved in aromatic hydrocarbon degradation n=1 Tax=Beijerinckia indica subsp. indica (strain ATCC 9039 / DSM 1715 / NCIMB 8712) TaxID=395963 RepID=B2ICW4_BEII9|nr:outer membrane protein transport protein [Beijerinckia indica]ACB95388.1 membrane protein involved in aromatic hydrocarbon degradation [Beijerinckia indica subsp. indica ATCC 9039]
MLLKSGSLMLTGTIACVIVSGNVGVVRAAGIELREQSADGLANAYAGVAAKAYNATTVFYNPAGMAFLQGNQIASTNTYIMPKSSFSGTVTGAGLSGTPQGGPSGQFAPTAPVGAMYAVWDYSANLKFGLAANTPFGLRTSYPDQWIGRYQALHSNITNFTFSPSVAYRINEQLSVGVGWQIGYFNAVLSQAINLPGLGLGRYDAHQSLSGNAVGFGGDIGFLYELDPATRVGLNYRSQIKYNLHGWSDVSAPTSLAALSTTFQSSGMNVSIKMPDMVTLSAYHEIDPRWAVMASVEWTNWSVLKELNIQFNNGRANTVIPENWHNSWAFSVGATYTADDRAKFHIGFAYDQSAISSANLTARLPDANRCAITGGYSYRLTEKLQAIFAYGHLFFDHSNISAQGTSAAGLLLGGYDTSANIVSIGLSMKL